MIKEGVLGELSELPNNCVYLKCVEGERIFNKDEIIYAESGRSGKGFWRYVFKGSSEFSGKHGICQQNKQL